jgi:hypothetical protein
MQIWHLTPEYNHLLYYKINISSPPLFIYLVKEDAADDIQKCGVALYFL